MIEFQVAMYKCDIRAWGINDYDPLEFFYGCGEPQEGKV